MIEIKKCLNEWNATIEALGYGKQTILIRKYGTMLNEFLLYPTVSYAAKDNYLNSYKEEYQSFIEENALPKKENNKFEVKYFAKVEEVIEKPSQRIGSFNNYHIWTKNHVKSYLGSGKAHIWVLRVYKLKNPVMAERSRALIFANLNENISLEGIEPVLSDGEFSKIVKEIESK